MTTPLLIMGCKNNRKQNNYFPQSHKFPGKRKLTIYFLNCFSDLFKTGPQAVKACRDGSFERNVQNEECIHPTTKYEHFAIFFYTKMAKKYYGRRFYR